MPTDTKLASTPPSFTSFYLHPPPSKAVNQEHTRAKEKRLAIWTCRGHAKYHCPCGGEGVACGTEGGFKRSESARAQESELPEAPM